MPQTYDYMTGQEAWDCLDNEPNRQNLLHEWWLSPNHFGGTRLPFQFCSQNAQDCSCLTSVKSGNGVADTDLLTELIRADDVIPYAIEVFYDMDEEQFIETIDHMVDCQQQMREGKYPGLEGSWLEESSQND